jgi:hypothetical protein
MANNRIYYAIQQVQLGSAAGTMTAVHGLQSVGITTNFNLEQVFELGQLAIYQNVEAVPDIEVTLNKVLDGYPLIYTLATEEGSIAAVDASIAGRQNARCDMKLAIFADNKIASSGNSIHAVTCSGMYVSSVSYTFPVDGNFTEDVTLVGNNKVWGGTVTGAFDNTDEPESATGVGRRQFLKMSSCVFPDNIPGISNGTNSLIGGGSGHAVHFQNITVSCDFGRESINELGTFAPYHRYVTFPVEVTSEFEVVAVSGDSINATESGFYGNSGACELRYNLQDQTIFLETCEGTRISLGDKNKLSSVNYTGGDTGGGNVSITYSYVTYNDFSVAHNGGDFYASLAP